MATPVEIALMTRLRDALLRALQFAHVTPAMDADAWGAQAEATNWLIDPNIDAPGRKPIYGYNVSGVHYLVDEQRGVWRFDVPTKKFVPL